MGNFIQFIDNNTFRDNPSGPPSGWGWPTPPPTPAPTNTGRLAQGDVARRVTVVNNINGAQDPAAVARAVSRAIQAGFSV